MTMGEMSAADIAAVTRPNFMGGYGACGGFGMGGFGGDWILGLIVLAALFNGGGFGGFGGNGGGWQQGFNTQNILSKLDGITNGLSDGFYAMNTNMLQAQNQLQRDLCQGFASVNSNIAENRFAAQQCCCETNRNIDAVRYEAAKNTCEIVRAIEKDGDATRALINANTMQALRDKLADKDRDIQTRDFQLSQLSQNAYIVNKLNPAPVPAYTVANPNCCSKPCGCGYFAE